MTAGSLIAATGAPVAAAVVSGRRRCASLGSQATPYRTAVLQRILHTRLRSHPSIHSVPCRTLSFSHVRSALRKAPVRLAHFKNEQRRNVHARSRGPPESCVSASPPAAPCEQHAATSFRFFEHRSHVEPTVTGVDNARRRASASSGCSAATFCIASAVLNSRIPLPSFADRVLEHEGSFANRVRRRDATRGDVLVDGVDHFATMRPPQSGYSLSTSLMAAPISTFGCACRVSFNFFSNAVIGPDGLKSLMMCSPFAHNAATMRRLNFLLSERARRFVTTGELALTARIRRLRLIALALTDRPEAFRLRLRTECRSPDQRTRLTMPCSR